MKGETCKQAQTERIYDQQSVIARRHAQPHSLIPPAEAVFLICGLRVGTRGLEPPQGASGKAGPQGGPLSGPPCFPAPLKTDTPLRGPESLSGALRGLWEGVSETPSC